jgi:hypothetical protein
MYVRTTLLRRHTLSATGANLPLFSILHHHHRNEVNISHPKRILAPHANFLFLQTFIVGGVGADIGAGAGAGAGDGDGDGVLSGADLFFVISKRISILHSAWIRSMWECLLCTRNT